MVEPLKNKLSTSKVLREVKSYLIITLSLLCYSLGWDIFLIPNNLVGGGVTGFAAIVFYSLKIPVSITFFVVNLILLAIALKVLGKAFGLKSVYAIIVTSLFLQFIPDIVPLDFINEIAISNGKLISAVFGGLLAGLGIGISFTQGGSTGGTDIIALMVAKYHNIAPGKVILYIDLCIITSSLLIPAKEVMEPDGLMIKETIGMRLSTVLYGYMLVATTSAIIDMVLSGKKQSVQAFIFSKNYEKIADAITKELGRGVTVLSGEGWYTKHENKMLMVVVHKTQQNTLYSLVREIDKDAFISMNTVSSVYGQGFEAMTKK
ncbi:MAG: YitT family protein [Candidatus Egerieousia sp.]